MLTEAANLQNLALVKDSLFDFINLHLPGADLSAIDDIILSYVYSTFDGTSEDFYDSLDADVVEDFSDMMSAYVADFNKIETNFICNWMIDIVENLERMTADNARAAQAQEAAREKREKEGLEIDIANVEAKKNKKGVNRTSSNSISEDEKETDRMVVFYEDEEHYLKCQALADMFPESNPMEIKHCISIAFGDPTAAADALLHRRDSGQALECSAWQMQTKVETVDDNEIKHRIIARYSYVDRESEAKEHKPAPPKNEPKKMVRYRDNKIVSLKGERYTEVPKSGEEEGVKKGNKKHNP